MIRFLYLVTLAFLLTSACKSGGEHFNQQIDMQELATLKTGLRAMTDTILCTNSDDWSTVAVGSKACGGPQFYIAYPKSINTTFLKKVKEYTKKEDIFNKKYNIHSTCEMIMPPSAVICQQGRPILVYNNTP